jgi:hypothetical protein
MHYCFHVTIFSHSLLPLIRFNLILTRISNVFTSIIRQQVDIIHLRSGRNMYWYLKHMDSSHNGMFLIWEKEDIKITIKTFFFANWTLENAWHYNSLRIKKNVFDNRVWILMAYLIINAFFFIYYVGTIIDSDIENDRSVWCQTQ